LPEREFIPHPTTWLNRDGWEDDPLPERTNGKQTNRDAAQALANGITAYTNGMRIF
jgi:hypothetical protein